MDNINLIVYSQFSGFFPIRKLKNFTQEISV